MGLGMFGVDLEGMTSELPPPLPPALRLGGALWLVVGQTGPLSLSDSALLEQLSWLGAEVHTVRDAEFAVQPATRRWPGVHAAVISASVREGFLRGSPLVAGVGPSLPLVVLDGPAWLSLQLAGRHEHDALRGHRPLQLFDDLVADVERVVAAARQEAAHVDSGVRPAVRRRRRRRHGDVVWCGSGSRSLDRRLVQHATMVLSGTRVTSVAGRSLVRGPAGLG